MPCSSFLVLTFELTRPDPGASVWKQNRDPDSPSQFRLGAGSGSRAAPCSILSQVLGNRVGRTAHVEDSENQNLVVSVEFVVNREREALGEKTVITRRRPCERLDTGSKNRCPKTANPGSNLRDLPAVARRISSPSANHRGRKEESLSSSTFAAEDLLRGRIIDGNFGAF